jgi:hypothetical protein
MSRTDAAASSPRPGAAELNRRIRLFCAGRLEWSRDALAELGKMQAAYLDARRAEDALSRDDVTEVA